MVKLTTDQKAMIVNLQNAVWKMEAAHEMICKAFPTKTVDEVDELFSGSIPNIIAKVEIGLQLVYES